MNDSLNHKIFTETDCLSEQTMFDYIDKKLSEKENHVVEKHLLHCDLCSDALEGLEMVKDRRRISTINQKVLEAVSSPLKETKIIRLNYKIILSVAATFLLLIGGVFFFNMLNQKNEMAEFKSDQTPTQETPPPPPPSAKSEETEGALGEGVPEAPEETAAAEAKNSTEKGTKTLSNKLFDQKEAHKAEQQDFAANDGAGDESEVPSRRADNSTVVINENEKIIATKSELSKTDEDSRNSVKDVDFVLKKPETGGAGAVNQDKFDAVYSTSTSAPKNSESKPAADAIERDDELSGYIGQAAIKNDSNKKRSESKAKRKEQQEEVNTIAYAPQSVTEDFEAPAPSKVSAMESIEQNPQYPGGQDSLISFIRKKYSPSLLVKNPQLSKQTAEVRFTIDKKGNLKNPQIVKGLNTEMDNELLRVLKLSPKWLPGSASRISVSKEVNLSVKLSKE